MRVASSSRTCRWLLASVPGDAVAEWYPEVPPEAGPDAGADEFCRETVEPVALAEVLLDVAESLRGGVSSKGARGWWADDVDVDVLVAPGALAAPLVVLEALRVVGGELDGRATTGLCGGACWASWLSL